jgi:hypothetical protein
MKKSTVAAVLAAVAVAATATRRLAQAHGCGMWPGMMGGYGG